MADVTAADDGTCPLHPVIQLRRRQRRTGEWKVILGACPLCASGLPPSEGISKSGPGAGPPANNAAANIEAGDDDDDVRSVHSSISHRPRHARGHGGHQHDDDRSVRSSRSEVPSGSHRSSSRTGSRGSGSRSRGHHERSSSRGHERSSSRGHERSSSRGHHERSSSRGHHERSSSRSGSRSRGHRPASGHHRKGHASRHSSHGLDFDEQSASSRTSKLSQRSASRTKSRHAEARADRGDDHADEDRSVATTTDHSVAQSVVSQSVSSLSTRPTSNMRPDAAPPSPPPQPVGVRFHPETKPPDERSVVSGAVSAMDEGEGEGDDDSDGSENSLSAASSDGSTHSGRNYESKIPSTKSSMKIATRRTGRGCSMGGEDKGGFGLLMGDEGGYGEDEGGFGEILGGEISGDHLSERNLDMISNIASAIHAANNAKKGKKGGGKKGGVRVPTKGDDGDCGGEYVTGIGNGVGNVGHDGDGADEYATEDEDDGSYSSLEDGSKASGFGDNKQPLPPRGVLRQSSYGPAGATRPKEQRAGATGRRGSHRSEEGESSAETDNDDEEALVMYEEPAEELDEMYQGTSRQGYQGQTPQYPEQDARPPERLDSGGSKQELYPPPPRSGRASHGQGGGAPQARPQEYGTPEQFRGKMYDGAPVNTPVEEYENYGNQGGRHLTPEQERFRPPPRDQGHGYREQGHPQDRGFQDKGGYQEQGYPEQGHQDPHRPQPPREDERSVHSQGRHRRSSSRPRGRDNDEDRSVHSQGRQGRGMRQGSNGRSRSQSRSRSNLRGRDEHGDSITSQPNNKPVGILRKGKHAPPPQRQPQEPPSPEGPQGHAPPHMPQGGRYAEAPERMQGNRGPPPPYGNNGMPPAPRSGPPSYPAPHLPPQGGPGGPGGPQRPGDYRWEPASKPKKSGSSRDGRDTYASQTEPETDYTDPPSREGSNNSSDRMRKADPMGARPPNSNLGAPSEFDDKGRCARHPHIKLRKKKLMGGWKVLLVNCPDCCIEEMLRMKRENNAGGGGGGKGRTKGGRKPKRRPSQDGSGSNGSNQSPPISQLTIRTHQADNSDVESTGSSASEITFNTRTDASRSSNPSELGSGGSGPHRVTRMPFTDAYGDKGWYTGEVASGSGLPHGQGTMHYCDGRTREGWWSNGLAGSGGGIRKGNRGPPPVLPPPMPRAPRGDGSVNSRSSGNRHLGPPPPQSQGFSPPPHHRGAPQHPQQMPPHRNLPPPPQKHQTNGAVFDVEWTDLRGRDGRYTGETDESGEPHGLGSVRYEDDTVLEGEWYHGELERRIKGLSVRPAGR